MRGDCDRVLVAPVITALVRDERFRLIRAGECATACMSPELCSFRVQTGLTRLKVDDSLASVASPLGVLMAKTDRARVALATIRTVNGAAALVAPAVFARRMTADANARAVASYPYRLFGIRTVILGLDLLLLKGESRERALQQAVVIHGVDTLSAVKAGAGGEVDFKFAVTTTCISAVNTLLAALALAGARAKAGV